MILGLQKGEFLFDAIARFRHGEFERLSLLWRALHCSVIDNYMQIRCESTWRRKRCQHDLALTLANSHSTSISQLIHFLRSICKSSHYFSIVQRSMLVSFQRPFQHCRTVFRHLFFERETRAQMHLIAHCSICNHPNLFLSIHNFILFDFFKIDSIHFPPPPPFHPFFLLINRLWISFFFFNIEFHFPFFLVPDFLWGSFFNYR